MIKLFDNGAYLLHGTELVEDNAEAGAVLASKRSTTHQTTWTISR